jgi:hypothetical protein
MMCRSQDGKDLLSQSLFAAAKLLQLNSSWALQSLLKSGDADRRWVERDKSRTVAPKLESEEELRNDVRLLSIQLEYGIDAPRLCQVVLAHAHEHRTSPKW